MEKLSKKIITITKELRSSAYKYGKIQNEGDVIPFGGSIRESIGPFPEFILKGRFCARSIKGLCSPCFYSRLPVHNICEQQFDDGYELQVEHILHNFNELVIKNQIGKVSCGESKCQNIYGMVCTPTGSYFDEHEYPINVRKSNLKKMIDTMTKYNCEIALHIESHAEDVIRYFEASDAEEIHLLHKLHTRVLLGFESVNDYSRNILYSKKLSISDFENAATILKENGFPVGAFIFAGLFAYTDAETIEDTTQSLLYLKEKKISPVLMFSNTQKYTIPDILLDSGKFKLLDPRTVAIIIKRMINIFGCEMNGDIDPWFIADPKGGPPDPNVHIFNATTSVTCPNCSTKIYTATENLRITKNRHQFLTVLNDIDRCDCLKKYVELTRCQNSISHAIDVFDRSKYLVEYTDAMIEYYILKENPWKVKAELLCYGLHMTDAQKETVSIFHPFIFEKGFINAIHITFKGVLINVCIAEKFCQYSPYSVCKTDDNNWMLLKDNVPLGPFTFLDFPDWVHTIIDGKPIGEIARPHSNNCISIWPSLNCSYIRAGNGCKYCGLNALPETDLIERSPEYIVEIVKIALAYNPSYEINLSGGTCCSPNRAIGYLSEICSLIIKNCGDVPISVECVPPDEKTYIEKLKHSGATAIVMNIEIYDEKLRKKVCPGKGLIGNDRYYSALKDAVKIFGRGNVSSVLIVGIQPKHDILSCCLELIELGVVPTLIPFKPLDMTPAEDENITNCTEYIEISQKVAIMLKNNHLKVNSGSGCAACGACSLEINLEEKIL